MTSVMLIEAHETEAGFEVAAEVHLVRTDVECAAWWTGFVRPNPSHAYFTAAFVEADRANSNGQYFRLKDLQTSFHTVLNSPLNVNHVPNRIVGAVVGAELLYPTTAMAAKYTNPYVEILACMWKAYWPDEYSKLEQAAASGTAHVSMEAVPSSLTCAECELTFSYKGTDSDTYCGHLQRRSAARILDNPVFTASALLLPPVRPGWRFADVHQLVAELQPEAAAEDTPEGAPCTEPASACGYGDTEPGGTCGMCGLTVDAVGDDDEKKRYKAALHPAVQLRVERIRRLLA